LSRYPSSSEFLAGTFLGFGVAMILILIVAHIGAASPFADVFPTMVGGIIAGYMVARRTAYNHVIIGLLIGVGSFFMTALFVILVIRTIAGLLWVWLGFLVGGTLGGMLIAAAHSRTSRKLTDEKHADSS
jgi:hypothetical protein